MKSFLLAAGKGTRLRPVSTTVPKCLIPIHGRPLLAIWLDLLARHGVHEVIINTHHLAERVAAFLESHRTPAGLRITRVHESQLLGSAGTLWHERHRVAAETDFLVAYADNLTDADLSALRVAHERHRQQGAVLTMALMRAENPRACGIVEVGADGRVTRFTEKPAHPRGDLANAGIYVASSALFRYFPPADDPCRPQPLDLGHHVLPRLGGRIFGHRVSGYIRDIGTPEAYRRALSEWPHRPPPGDAGGEQTPVRG